MANGGEVYIMYIIYTDQKQNKKTNSIKQDIHARTREMSNLYMHKQIAYIYAYSGAFCTVIG